MGLAEELIAEEQEVEGAAVKDEMRPRDCLRPVAPHLDWEGKGRASGDACI